MFTLLVKQMEVRMLLTLLLSSMAFLSVPNMPVDITRFPITTDFSRDETDVFAVNWSKTYLTQMQFTT